MAELLNDGAPFLSAFHANLGMTRTQLYYAVSHRRVRRMFRNVFVDARATDSRLLRAAAIALVAPPYAVVCGEWAAWLWGVDVFPPGRRHNLVPSVLVPHHYGRVRFPGVECREAHIRRSDRTMLGGITVTTPLRTTTDLMRHQRRPHAMASTDAMARCGLVTVDELWDVLPWLKGYPGVRQARSMAMLADPAAASAGESWTRLRVVDAGFAIPTSQLEVVDTDGVLRYLDLAYPELQIAVEYDGRGFHTGVSDQIHDDFRRDQLRALGFKFVIATYERIVGDDMTFENDLGALLGQSPRRRNW